MLPSPVGPPVVIQSDPLRRLAAQMKSTQEKHVSAEAPPGPVRTQKPKRALEDEQEIGVAGDAPDVLSKDSPWHALCSFAVHATLAGMLENHSFMRAIDEKPAGLESDRAITCYKTIVDRVHEWHGISSEQRKRLLKDLHARKATLTTITTFFDESRTGKSSCFIPGAACELSTYDDLNVFAAMPLAGAKRLLRTECTS